MTDFILGVAGHVDHGKTALTYALTGVETDRLAEEKRRGLTIEPGFAALPLPGGGVAGLVDVPGHEKFIRNMLTGAAGLDAVLLCVAADDGVMPQTREHLEICALLGVARGLVAITKRDLADETRLLQLEEEIRHFTAGTFLQNAPILSVSARTGAGIPALIYTIVKIGASASDTNVENAPFRLPVDRVFSKEGFGTVVTGALTGGTVSTEDTVQLYPSETLARVRGLQRHGVAVHSLTAGHRAAVNLAGVRREEIPRGATVAAPGSLTVTSVAAAQLALLPTAPFSVKTGSLLHLYHGAGEYLCRCTLQGRKILAPGESCTARLRFDRPLAARAGDRFVLRFFSPTVTVGGGVLTGFGEERREETRREQAPALLAEYHTRYPLRDGMPLAEFVSKTGSQPEEWVEVKRRGTMVALREFRPKYTPELAKIRDQIEVYYRRRKTKPTENKLADALFDREVIRKLLQEGVLVPLGKDKRIHRRYLDNR